MNCTWFVGALSSLSFFVAASLGIQAQVVSTPRLVGVTEITVTDPTVVRILGAVDGATASGTLLDGLVAEWRMTGDVRLFHAAMAAAAKNSDGASASTDVMLFRVFQDRKYYLAAEAAKHSMETIDGGQDGTCKLAEQGRFLALYGVTFKESDTVQKAVATEKKALQSRPKTVFDEACIARVGVDLAGMVTPEQATELRAATVTALLKLQKSATSSNDEATRMMAVYALAKGTRLGVLPLSSMDAAVKLWNASAAPEQKENNEIDGAYLLALSEMTARARAAGLFAAARGGKVLFDGWFNQQFRKDVHGQDEIFHYKADDDADSGYSIWAEMFEQYGMQAHTLQHAPTPADFAGVKVYVIASPEAEGSRTGVHLMDEASSSVISSWVHAGGVLVIMQNDNVRADQVRFNLLSDQFGIHFNATMRNSESSGGGYAPTLVTVPAGAGGIFTASHIALMKETCTITVAAPAQLVVTTEKDGMMAQAHAGHGTVFAATDPWLYNEYTDGRKLPLGEDGFAAAEELTQWMVRQAVH